MAWSGAEVESFVPSTLVPIRSRLTVLGMSLGIGKEAV